MTLHILSNPEKSQLCQLSLSEEDSVLLIADGTYCAASWPNKNTRQLSILSDDATARGLTTIPDLKYINYNEFVALSVQHKNSISWF